MCANGCCCGHTEHGYPPVPTDLYHDEWERRRLRPHVHLSMGGCLGPCPLANVAMLLFDGRPLWFHSCNTEEQIRALYDYIEALVEAQAYIPPPPELADRMFTAFRWDGDAQSESAPVARDSVAVGIHRISISAEAHVLHRGNRDDSIELIPQWLPTEDVRPHEAKVGMRDSVEHDGIPLREDHGLHWHPALAPIAHLHARGKVTVFPAIGYSHPDQ